MAYQLQAKLLSSLGSLLPPELLCLVRDYLYSKSLFVCTDEEHASKEVIYGVCSFQDVLAISTFAHLFVGPKVLPHVGTPFMAAVQGMIVGMYNGDLEVLHGPQFLFDCSKRYGALTAWHDELWATACSEGSSSKKWWVERVFPSCVPCSSPANVDWASVSVLVGHPARARLYAACKCSVLMVDYDRRASALTLVSQTLFPAHVTSLVVANDMLFVNVADAIWVCDFECALLCVLPVRGSEALCAHSGELVVLRRWGTLSRLCVS